MGIVIFSIGWEWIQEQLEHHAAAHHETLTMIAQKVINELAVLGTISFAFLMVNCFYDLPSNAFLTYGRSRLISSLTQCRFEVAHLMLFFFGVIYCLQALYSFLIIRYANIGGRITASNLWVSVCSKTWWIQSTI